MPYAMCLFFLLAGYFTPGSYNRKGPLRHVYDRLIRLIIPVVVYAVLIVPLMLTVNKAAGIPAGNPHPFAVLRSMSYSETWRFWFANFHIAAGPTWFVWCLFWFAIGYVLLRLLHSTAQGFIPQHTARARAAVAAAATSVLAKVKAAAATTDAATGTGSDTVEQPSGAAEHVVVELDSSSVDQQKPCAASADSSKVGMPAIQEYSITQVLICAGVLTLTFTAVSFGALMATYDSNKASGYDAFWVPAPLVIFRPSWFGPNAISFILGIQAMKHNMLRRLPARMTFWCLGAAVFWWPLGNMMPRYIDTPYRPKSSGLWGVHPVAGPMVGYVLYMSFAAWAFAVVWGLGMLLLFREWFNGPPGKFGRQVIAGAYGAYIIHPLLIPLWAWAFKGLRFWTLAGNAIAVSPLVVLSSWVFTALVRCIPGTQRVLG